MTTTTQTAYQFFYANAGYGYDPITETPEQGKARGARLLARAERRASASGMSFHWFPDPEATSAEFDDKTEPYRLWCCVAQDASHEVVASLGAVDFGPEGDPWTSDYRRVVEAELALEAQAMA